MILKIGRVAGVASVVLIAALLTTFAIPVKEWRTGDQGLSPLTFMPVQEGRDDPRGLWIDTDAACGQSARTDPDDCFAIALLAGALDFEIVGLDGVIFIEWHNAVEASKGQKRPSRLSGGPRSSPRARRGSDVVEFGPS